MVRKRTKFGKQRGSVSLEMALVMPVFLLLVLGTATLGHALVVRFLLSSGAYDAARTCALARQPNSNCARTILLRKLGTMARWCNNLDVTGVNTSEVGFPDVNALEVRVNCSYRGTVGTGFLKSHGIVIANIRARAVMPY